MHPNDGRVVSNFIVQALQGNDITIYGDGQQTRSFCYVDDLIEGFVRLMASPAKLTGPINLGNPSEFTIRELAETVLDLVGGNSKLIYRPLPHDDPKQRQPDIAMARSELDWAPEIPLKDGLRKTIGYSTPGWASVVLGIMILMFLQTGVLALMTLMLTGVVRSGTVTSELDYQDFIDEILVSRQISSQSKIVS